MSHIAKVKLQFKDLDALKLACADLGLKFVEGQTSFRWEGWHKDKCEHAIQLDPAHEGYAKIPVRRRDGEIGLVKTKDGEGYELKFGAMDQTGRIIGRDGANLKTRYGVQVAKGKLRKQGYTVRETVKDGRVQLRATPRV